MGAHRPLAALALAALALGWPARAQQPAASPSPTPGLPVFPGGVEQVVVDVVVAGDNGQAVAGLTAADFTLKEDEAAREILSFEAVAPEDAAAPADQARLIRVFAIVYDDLHLTAAAGERAKEALRGLISTGLRDSDDVVLLRTSTGQTWSGRVGTDRVSLSVALEKMRGLGTQPRSCEMSDEEALQIATLRDFEVQNGVYDRYLKCGLLLREPAGLLNPSPAEGTGPGAPRPTTARPGSELIETWAREQHQRSLVGIRSTYAALERLLRALTPLRGRKSVILASEGFVLDRGLVEVKGVVSAASDANAAVSFLDVRALTPRALTAAADAPPAPDASQLGRLHRGRFLGAEATERLAEDTGGSTIRGHDLGQGLRRLADESRAYYLLGYSPRDPALDGKFRAIRVDVKRPGGSVRARRGYYAVARASLPPVPGAPAAPPPAARPAPPAGTPDPAGAYGGDAATVRARVAGWSKEEANRAVAALKAGNATDEAIEAAALAHAAAAFSAADPAEHQARAARNAAALVRDPARRSALERRVLLGLAHRFLDARQWQVAQDLAQEASWRLPDDAEAQLALGIVQETTGSVVDGGRRPLPDQARLTAGYDELVSRNPVTGFNAGVPGGPGRTPDTQQRMSQGSGPTSETRLRQAAESYRRALKARPDLLEARLRLGRTLALLSELKPAVKELESVAGETDPGLAYLARLFLGDLKEQQNDFAGAASEYRAALAVRPGSAVALLAIARAEEAGGERAAAQAALESLLVEPADDAQGDPWWSYRLRPLDRWAAALEDAR